MKAKLGRKSYLFAPLVAAAICIAAGAWAAQVWADTYSDPGGVPRLVPFRGHLEQSGVPVTSSVAVTFTAYDAPTGGTLLWGPETHTITPSGGDFSVLLGSTMRLPPSVLEGGDAYVQVAVGAAVLGRQRLGSVPYALRSANGAPSGSIMAFGATTAPSGWILCDGRALDREDPAHAALFAAIGTTWGDGTAGAGAQTGVTDFNAPDLRGRFLRAADDRVAGSRLSADVPGRAGVLQGQATALPSAAFVAASAGSHTHQYPVYAGTYQAAGSPAGDFTGAPLLEWRNTTAAGAHAHAITGGDVETRPFSASVIYIIKL